METKYNYSITFDFDCIGKKGNISRKCGEINITTTVPVPMDLSESKELISLIKKEMERKTKKTVFNVVNLVANKS